MRLICLSIIVVGLLFADPFSFQGDLILEDKPLFVSLGSHCETAVQIRENNLRNVAFPFDWLLTLDNDHFCLVLEEDFLFFFDERLLVPHFHYCYLLENHRYEIEFRHEWPFPDHWTDANRSKLQMEKFRSKYQRRIDRFRQLRRYPGKVFFIRAAYDFNVEPNIFWARESHARLTSDQARILKKALDRYFPDLDFTLVVLNYLEENVPNIEGIDGVIEFKIRKTNKRDDYKEVFRILPILCKWTDSIRVGD